MKTMDKRIKDWAIKIVSSLGLAVFTYLCRGYLLIKIYVPIFVFPLLVLASFFIALYLVERYWPLRRDSQLAFLHQILKPGQRFSVDGGDSNLTVLEWSWLNPRIVIGRNQLGHKIRVHSSSIIWFT